MKIKERSFSIEFESCSENESFARGVIAAFLVSADPTVEELTEIKTAVSEAVSNCIIHGYGREETAAACNSSGGLNKIFMNCSIEPDGRVTISIRDEGCGIEDIEMARAPLFTTDTDGERSGMGFTVMESFMDHVSVKSEKGIGTEVILVKKLDTGYEH